MEWSPYDRFLIACGSSQGDCKVLDQRVFCKSNDFFVWSGTGHCGKVDQIAWNPFVPYWIATAGDDALISIWDLRFNSKSPMLKLSRHTGSITDLHWSMSHCDMLFSAGLDCSLRCWSLRSDPFDHHLFDCQFDDEISDILPSSKSVNTYFAAKSWGGIEKISINNDFLECLVEHRFMEEDESIPRSIESRIYLRDLESAYSFLIDFARKSGTNPSNYEKLSQLTALTEPFILDQSCWEIKSFNVLERINDILSSQEEESLARQRLDKKQDLSVEERQIGLKCACIEFYQDVEKFSQSLPPNFNWTRYHINVLFLFILDS